MEHQMQEISVRPVALVPHPSSDEPVVLPIGEAEFGVGCASCGLSMQQAILNPECTGQMKPRLAEITTT